MTKRGPPDLGGPRGGEGAAACDFLAGGGGLRLWAPGPLLIQGMSGKIAKGSRAGCLFGGTKVCDRMTSSRTQTSRSRATAPPGAGSGSVDNPPRAFRAEGGVLLPSRAKPAAAARGKIDRLQVEPLV